MNINDKESISFPNEEMKINLKKKEKKKKTHKHTF